MVLCRGDVDILMLTEHWQSAESITEVSVGGLRLVSHFCRESGRHGGVSLYCSLSIDLRDRPDICALSVAGLLECTGAELLTDKKYIIVVVYRPPSAPFNLFVETFMSLLEVLGDEDGTVLIGGDFNVNLLAISSSTRVLIDLLCQFNLCPLIATPTRVTSCSSSCIDNFFVDLSLKNCGVYCIDLDLSDHCALILDLYWDRRSAPAVDPPTILKRKFCVNSLSRFRDYLSGESWREVYERESVDAAYTAFSDALTYYLDLCFPLMRRSPGQKNDNFRWITPDLIDMKNKLLFLKDMSSRYEIFKTHFQEYSRFYNEMLRANQIRVNNSIILESSNKTKAVWSLINSKRSNYSQHHTLPDADFSGDVLECFAAHFSSSVTGLVRDEFGDGPADVDVVDSAVPRVSASFFLDPVCDLDVLSAIHGVSVTGAGDDTVPAFIIKQSADLLVSPLVQIINLSFCSGVFPSRLKSAIIKPLYKKGDKNDVCNYRPISLLNFFSKIIEKIINDKLHSYLNKYQIISTHQHGFCRGRSVDTAIYDYTSNIHNCIDRRAPCVGLFVDLSKAFDTVNHSLLLRKMERYGIAGVVLDLFRSYLSHRQQRVCVGGDMSVPISLDIGVPQGSILGPTLFLLYVNDLPGALHGVDVSLYADDINVLISADSMEGLVAKASAAYESVTKWLSLNRLIINSAKTKCLMFSGGDDIAQIQLGRVSVRIDTSCRLLGLEVDDSLSWSNHIAGLATKLSRSCYALHQLKRSCGLEVVKTFYFSNFYSQMRFGVIHWGMNSNSSRIFILQKRAIRIMFSIPRGESCRAIFKDHGLMTFYDVYILEILCFVYRFKERFDNSTEHGYHTRHSHRLLPIRHRYSAYQRSLNYMGCKLFNALPNKCRSVGTFLRFRNNVKHLLLSISCYSIDEFLIATRSRSDL